MWRKALRTFTSSFSWCFSRKTDPTLAKSATSATASMSPCWTGSGCTRRRRASRAMRTVMAMRTTAFARAASTSARLKP
jgi:hypothetical protein